MKKNVHIIIGANYGDEGKGLMTDFFCAEARKKGNSCLVICTNGGAQRGHTVTSLSGLRHIFHHFGSGTFAGADTLFCDAFIVNPMLFRQEYEELAAYGVWTDKARRPRIYADPACRWSTPYDMMVNQMAESFRGDKRHGSCGVGIWETVLRYRRGSVSAGSTAPAGSHFPENGRWKSLWEMEVPELRQTLLMIRDEYMPERIREIGLPGIPEDWKDIWYSGDLIENFLDDIRFFRSHTEPDGLRAAGNYDTIVMENAQGLLLDMSIKDHLQHTTPSHTDLTEPVRLLTGIPGEKEIEVCYISRTYLTRHGAGPMEHCCPKADIDPDMTDLTNVPNPFQGTLRYGMIDTEKLAGRIRKDFQKSCMYTGLNCRWTATLALTHLNETGGVIAGCTENETRDFLKGFGRVYLSDGETCLRVYKAQTDRTFRGNLNKAG